MESPNTSGGNTVLRRTLVVIGIMLFIAFVHAFRMGTYFEGRLYTLYYSYFSDIIIPFGFYFLLSLNDRTVIFLRDWRMKAGIVFLACTLTEILQAFGIYFLGVTFDPVDIAMFGVGVLLAVFVDRVVFRRVLPFWAND